MARSKRFLFYVQHLSGTGHFVRIFEIARALAEAHDVYLTDGGRPVPGRESQLGVSMVPLPRIYRGRRGIEPLQPRADIALVMQERVAILREAVDRVKPDVIVVEHFPFSKWELAAEIMAVIDRARAGRRRPTVVCSLRDVCPRTKRDPEPARYRRLVLDTLGSHFDALLVHGDPELIRLEETVPWAATIRIPVLYTGYVSRPPKLGGTDTDGTVIASGGGAGGLPLIGRCVEAWQNISSAAEMSGRELEVFVPLFAPEEDVRKLRNSVTNKHVRIRDFSVEFHDRLQAADLSISHAGYNTCADLLRSRTRAILIPNPSMSDQEIRARRLADRGLAHIIDASDCDSNQLGQTMLEALSHSRPSHQLNLEGVERTREILESHAETFIQL